jgi:Fe-S-cluster containining protein
MWRSAEAPLRTEGSKAVAALCPACGFCCNGVLFADVELQRGDAPARLRALGVKRFAKGGKRRFGQPCACFDGEFCRIYAERPERCRTFECRLLKRVMTGELSSVTALKSIAAATLAVEAVRRLVRELAETDETLPLSRRYARIMAQPIDFAGDKAVIKRRSELMLAVDRLAKILERDFLT